MKKEYKYKIGKKEIVREYEYIPIRFIISLIFIVLEVALIIGLAIFLCYKEPWLYLVAVVAQTYCVLKIIASNDNPEYKAPWLLVVIVLPIAGFMLYFIFYSRQLGRRYVKRLKEISKTYYKKDDGDILQRLKSEDEIAHGQAKMLCSTADSCIFASVKQTYFSSGETMMQSLLEDLKGAKRFIYLEFFIIEKGLFWDCILQILKRKVKEGVEVKVIYDDFGCMTKLPADYYKTLKSYGIESTVFSYLKPTASSELNNRTHRKIVVIDGFIGYTGGVNVADEYINKKSLFGHWKDCAIRIEGEAVWEFTELFLTDFGLNVRKLPAVKQELYPLHKLQNESGYVIPFGDGPTPIYWRRVAKSAIQSMVECSTRYCYITTPYLIPDNDLCLSLENASLRGVDVRIVVPHIPDKKLVFAISKSYYQRLMKAGVKIYEYLPGFIHAKSYLVDDKYAIIGTVNLDYRSLAHNFENGVWLYKTQCLKDIKADMQNVFEKSLLMNDKKSKNNPFYRFLCAVIRIFAPLM